MSGQPSGFSPIDRETAGWLAPAWTRRLGGPVASSPTVYGRTVYVGDWSGTEWSIDAETGQEIAARYLGLTDAPQCNPPALGVTSAGAADRGVLFVAGGDDSFYALDLADLSIRWRRSLGDNSATGGYYGWCSPAVVGDRVLQGIASNCDNPFVPGGLVALDARTGDLLASVSFVPRGQVGNGIWTSPAVDVEAGKVFVTTGSGLAYGTGLGYSIVRLDLASLSVEDWWKVGLSGPFWDADWGSSPTLFLDPQGRKLVGAGHKDGHYYGFDRGRLGDGPVWSTAVATEGEVPQGGDGTISTAAFDGARLYVGGGIPPEGSGDVLGSVSALDPATGAILWRAGFPGPVLAPVSVVNGVAFAAGGNLVAAIDGMTGRFLWSFQTPSPCYGGIAIAGKSILFGDQAGNLYRFSIY